MCRLLSQRHNTQQKSENFHQNDEISCFWAPLYGPYLPKYFIFFQACFFLVKYESRKWKNCVQNVRKKVRSACNSDQLCANFRTFSHFAHWKNEFFSKKVLKPFCTLYGLSNDILCVFWNVFPAEIAKMVGSVVGFLAHTGRPNTLRHKMSKDEHFFFQTKKKAWKTNKHSLRTIGISKSESGNLHG